jgi:cell division protein FtsZ
MGIGTRAARTGRSRPTGAISSPLLEASIDGAHGVLLSISGGSDLGLFEVNEAAEVIHASPTPTPTSSSAPSSTTTLGDEVRVTVIAAGFDRCRRASGARRLRIGRR